MTWFLLKGLLRDRHRSLFPIIIVAGGVMLTILLNSWIAGFSEDMLSKTATLDTGHLKIMTRSYAEISSQLPNDLAVANLTEFMSELKRDYPNFEWTPRIKFAGLLDIPDENGETKEQGPVFGLGVDLLSDDSKEVQRLNLENAVVSGRLPNKTGEILVSEKLAQNLNIKLGEMATLIGSTANGGMAIYNFIVIGTVKFGVAALDNNTILVDLSDVQYALEMENGAGEILGFFPNTLYNHIAAQAAADSFNAKYGADMGEYAPIMLTLKDTPGLGQIMDLIDLEMVIVIGGLVFVMSIVLWNTGLMSGLRRYGEFGVRLAMGEAKRHVYFSLLYESILIGLVGSLIGTIIGLGFSYYLQEVGIDIASMSKGSTMIMPTVMRAKINLSSYYIGFVPGLLGIVLGTMIAGLAVFRRQTSQLFKELEA